MLALSGVDKSYSKDGPPLLRGLSMLASDASLVAISGQVESGKSTLLRLIAGIEVPDAGTIELFGREVIKLRRASLLRLRRRMGLMPQEIALQSHRSVADNVALPLEIVGTAKVERRRRAQALCEELGLGDVAANNVMQLSTGQRRLVCLARAAVADPECMILDAPTSDLDDTRSQRVCRFLRDRTSRGVLVLAATTDPRLIAAAHRHLELHNGALLESMPAYQEPAVQNIVPFPITARLGGVAE